MFAGSTVHSSEVVLLAWAGLRNFLESCGKSPGMPLLERVIPCDMRHFCGIWKPQATLRGPPSASPDTNIHVLLPSNIKRPLGALLCWRLQLDLVGAGWSPWASCMWAAMLVLQEEAFRAGHLGHHHVRCCGRRPTTLVLCRSWAPPWPSQLRLLGRWLMWGPSGICQPLGCSISIW